jgi:hypothetical protein
VSGVRERGASVSGNGESEAGGLRRSAADEATVEGFENGDRVRGEFSGAADGPDKQPDRHASLQPLASDVSGDDQHAAVRWCGMIWKKSPPTSRAALNEITLLFLGNGGSGQEGMLVRGHAEKPGFLRSVYRR